MLSYDYQYIKSSAFQTIVRLVIFSLLNYLALPALICLVRRTEAVKIPSVIYIFKLWCISIDVKLYNSNCRIYMTYVQMTLAKKSRWQILKSLNICESSLNDYKRQLAIKGYLRMTQT